MKRRTRTSPVCSVATEETTRKEEENFVAQTGAVVVITDGNPPVRPHFSFPLRLRCFEAGERESQFVLVER